MVDEMRITQGAVNVDVAANEDQPVRITQGAVNVDVAANEDLPMRISQAVLMVDIREVYGGVGATFGPLLQVM